MRRDAVRVRVTKEQHQQLRNLLSLTYNLDLVAKQYPLVRELEKQISDDLLDADEVDELIEKARELHCKGSDEDIEIDDDAALSRADDGTWVGGWLWVPRPEDEDDGEAEEQVPAAPADDQGGSPQEGAPGRAVA